MRVELEQIVMALSLHYGLVMKKTTRKLALRTETIRSLTPDALRGAVGGVEPIFSQGFIMKDTVIIPRR